MSWQARAISFLLRHTFKPRLVKADTVEKARAVFNAASGKTPPDCTIDAATVGGVPGEWVQRRGPAPTATLLYIHGGGYFACSPQTHRDATTYFARAGFRTFVPKYRLAPEAPFPGGLEDVEAAYRALLASGVDPDKLVVAGDSAGGGLALSLALTLRDKGVAAPAALALFSPLTDLTSSGASIAANSRKCAMFTQEIMPRAGRYYLGDRDLKHPVASPLFAELKGLPSMLIHVGLNEVLYDDSRRFAERARAAGVPVTYREWPDVPHVWQLMHRFIPEGRESLEETIAFFRAHSKETRAAA